MSVKEKIEAKGLKLLQEYVDIVMDMLEAILKDNSTSYEYLTELSQRITTQLQEQYPNYIFYVGKGSAQVCMPMGIPVSPAKFVKLLKQKVPQKRCKQCDGVLD